jgi:hypothetical protein
LAVILRYLKNLTIIKCQNIVSTIFYVAVVNKAPNMALPKHTPVLIVLILGLLLLAPSVNAEILVPEGVPAFIQTSGPNTPFGNGDYRASSAGDNAPHEIAFNVACTPGETYTFQLFDPSSDVGFNPPGAPPDGTTPRVLDEVAGGADNTFFRLFRGRSPSVGGALTAEIQYASGSFDGAWTTIYTLGPLPANPTPGVDCGDFTIRARTADNDENGWRFRILGGDDTLPEEFDPTVGPDGLAGTGDESWVGLVATSYQHAPAGCQNFYWFSNDGNTNMYMLNFDLDGGINTVTYTSPSGDVITGRTSGGAGWNDTPPPQAARPGNAGLMDPFNPPGDLIGDAVANPESGVWSAELCVNATNQYSFEVPGAEVVFLEPPILPRVIIDKDDFVVPRTSPGSTEYTITITNVEAGAAMPIPGPEMTDQIPTGMVFDYCIVNPPLVGTCTHTGGGNVAIDLEAQSTTTLAYLAGNTNPGPGAPSNTGTITLGVNIVPGLAAGTTLDNVADVDWTDIYGNDYTPVSDNDVDIIDDTIPGVTIDISGVAPAACEGDVINLNYNIVNVGAVVLDPVIITDSLGSVITPAIPALNPADTATGTATYTILPGDLPLTITVEVTATTPAATTVTDQDILVVNARGACGTTTADDDDDDGGGDDTPPSTPVAVATPVICPVGMTYAAPQPLVPNAKPANQMMTMPENCVIITQLPATGESPWSKWRLPVFVLAAVVGLGGLSLAVTRRTRT